MSNPNSVGLRTNSSRTRRLADWKVLNMEMESSTLLTLGNLSGVRTGAVCAVYSNRVRGEWISDALRSPVDEAAEWVGLEAVRLLAAMDATDPI